MMKYTRQIILFTGLLFFESVSAGYDQINDNANGRGKLIEFTGNEVFIPERLGNLKLYKDCDGFHILKDGEICEVQNCFCDPILRKMSDEQLAHFLGRNKPKIIILTPEEFSQIDLHNFVEITLPEENELLNQFFSSGYISVNQMDDGKYILHAKVRVQGGRLPIYVGALVWGSLAAVAGACCGAFIGIGQECAALGGSVVVVGYIINRALGLITDPSDGHVAPYGLIEARTPADQLALLAFAAARERRRQMAAGYRDEGVGGNMPGMRPPAYEEVCPSAPPVPVEQEVSTWQKSQKDTSASRQHKHQSVNQMLEWKKPY